MEQPENLHLIVRPITDLTTAIADWLTARGEYQKQASDDNQDAYNATYFALGEAWAELNPEAAGAPGGFESFRRILIAPEEA